MSQNSKYASECYRCRINGVIMPSRYKSGESAINEAKNAISDGYEASVEYWSKSGTSHSTMQVWPATGEMYSDHHY